MYAISNMSTDAYSFIEIKIGSHVIYLYYECRPRFHKFAFNTDSYKYQIKRASRQFTKYIFFGLKHIRVSQRLS